MEPLLFEQYRYDRDSSIGDALRAWVSANNTNSATAATFLHQAGVRGAIGNFPKWLASEPVGELFTFRAKKFGDVTGIDLDRLIVIAAKREILAENPELDVVIRFDRHQTREDLVQTLEIYVECYGRGGSRHVAYQLGVEEGKISKWIARRYLPGGADLKKLVIGMSRGLIQAMCAEDYFLTVLCRRLLGLEPSNAVDGMRDFQSLVSQLHGILGTRNRARDKTDVFGLPSVTVDRIRKWQPEINSLPIETVATLLRSILRQKNPELVRTFDERIGPFLTEWTAEVKKPKNETDKPVPEELEEPSIPVPKPSTEESGLATRQNQFRIAIGEIIDEIEHCLGPSGFPDFQGVIPTEEDARRIDRILERFRELMLTLDGLSEAQKTWLMKRGRIADNIEETAILQYFFYKVDNARAGLSMFNSQLDMTRSMRPNKKGGKR